MARGGKRPGSGRPEGARNKRSIELEQKAREAAATIERVLAAPFKGDSHGLLMAIYKDPDQPLQLRVEAAKAAIRYEKPALASIDVSAAATVRHVILAEPLTAEERDREWIEKHAVVH